MSIPLDLKTPTAPAEMPSPTEAIGRLVMSAIGRPDDFRGVLVRPIWDDRYRVNVLRGKSDAFVTIARSYFLVARDGVIVESTPALRREY